MQQMQYRANLPAQFRDGASADLSSVNDSKSK